MPLKPKKAQAPTQTLHHFFNPTPILPSQSKTRRRSRSKLTEVDASKRPARSSTQHEIIVIDSDDDDDEVEIVEPTSIKRRKLTPRKSGNSTRPIKAEYSPTLKHSSFKENEGTVLRESPSDHSKDSLSFGRPFLLVNSSSSGASEEANDTTFGEPFLLKSPTTSTSEVHSTNVSNTLMHSSDGKGFGEPFLLRSSPAINKPDVPWNATNASAESSSSLLDIKSENLPLGPDKWETGDDERDLETFVEDDYGPDWATEEGQLQEGSSMNIEISNTSKKLTSMQASAESVLTCEKRATGSGSNAFSILMTSFKENEVWKEATVADDRNFRPMKSNGNRRHAPFYKVLQGMPIAVDAFKYGAIPGVTAYFLTHAHSDHYTNLSSKWNNGPIYCSDGTANLIVHMLSVDRKWVHPLPMDTPTIIPNTGGVTVTLIEANHCPGSCLFFFEGLQTANAGDSNFKSSYVGSSRVFRYLHCGDFRASPYHILHPAVKDKVIDHVYLDTTYLDPKYTFPPQPLVISACADLAKRAINGHSLKEKNSSSVLSWMMGNSAFKGKGKEVPSRPLVVIGTYSIGKERIAKAVAFALKTKIYCDARKMAILKCQADPQLHQLLTSNPEEGHVHLIPLSSISTDQLKLYLEKFKNFYDTIIAFRPTGWTYTQPAGTNQSPSVSSILSASITSNYTFADLQLSPRSTPTLQLYPVPYSEHSSFHELTCFAMSFNWKKMIATVNVGSEKSREKMAKWVDKWEAERRKRGKDTIVPHRHPDYW